MITSFLTLLLLSAKSMATLEKDGDGNVRVKFFNNAMVTGNPKCVDTTPISAEGVVLNTSTFCGEDQHFSASTPASIRVDGEISNLNPNSSYSLVVTTTLGLRLYVHGWTLVDAWTLPEPKLVDVVTIVAKRNFTNMGATSHKLRIDAVATSTRAFLQLQWSVDGSAVVPLPSSVLSATVSAAEEMRQSMQANMSIGWNTWSRPSATAHVHLPTGFGFDVAINDTTTGTVTTGGVVDRCETLGQCVVRPGAHEYNGSYTHLTQVVRVPGRRSVESGTKADGGATDAVAVITESAHLDASGDGTVVVLLSVVNASQVDFTKLAVSMSGKFYFDCYNTTCTSSSVSTNDTQTQCSVCGKVSITPDNNGALTAVPNGFLPIQVSMISGNDKTGTFDSSGRLCIVASWVGPSVRGLPITIDACAAVVNAAAARVEAERARTYGPVGTDVRDAVEALRAVVGWNTMWDPRTTVITPVSRSFGQMPFEMWLWDTYFCTLLAAEHDKHVAYTNLIEITRPTVLGNVPGFRSATTSVGDRSKPYVGAMILLDHYNKFKDLWLVELLFDDLLMWTNWIRDKRVHQGLVFLGTENVARVNSDGNQCTTIAAKWESGLDNSPMYDHLEIVKNSSEGGTCALPLYDVGMTGLYAAQCDALARLADLLPGHAPIATDLRARVSATTAALQAHMWDDDQSMFLNAAFGSLVHSPSVSPFNFHPLLTGAASPQQAAAMATKWLLNNDGFCLDDDTATSATPSLRANANATLSLYYSKKFEDNAICLHATADAHCPSTMDERDGYVYWHDTSGYRNEGAGMLTSSSTNASQQLHYFYSSANHDNYVGFDPRDASYRDLGATGVWIATGENGSGANMWSLDVYWNAQRKDMQTAANPLTLKYMVGYDKVAHLGHVTATPTVPNCTYGLPSIAHKDPGYGGDYWRGRVWGPMNYLVYSGLRHEKYSAVDEVTKARQRLVNRSRTLLLLEWRKHGHVHENYDPSTGIGCNVHNSNPFYTWGALLGHMTLKEENLV